jgi:hypothetical protein
MFGIQYLCFSQIMLKKTQAATQDASWSKLPPLNSIFVIQGQLFDNTKQASGVKGQSDYALKLFVYVRDQNIRLRSDADWWRVVQLLDPKTFIRWAEKKHGQGGMTDEEFAVYQQALQLAEAAQQTGNYDLVRLGHIASPPGKQYFVGQFVLVMKENDTHEGPGPLTAVICNGGTLILDDWKPTRKRGKYRKVGTPILACLHDPLDIVGRTRRENEALDALRGLQTASSTQGEECQSTDPVDLLQGFITQPGAGVF